MKNRVRKIVAALTAAVLLCALLPLGGLASVSAADAGLLVNGGFETGNLNGWSSYQSTAISKEDAHSGSYSVKLAGNGGWGGLLNQTVEVEAGKTYSFSFWYKAVSCGVNVKLYSPSDTGTSYCYKYMTATTWTQVTFEFVASNADGMVTINFCGSGTGTAEVMYVDDMVMTEVKQASFDGYIYNGDFEIGIATPWRVFQNTAVSTAAAYSGNYGLVAKGNGGWGGLLEQNFTVRQNTDYVIKYAVKAVSNGLNIQLRNADNTGNVYYTYLDTSRVKDWTKVEATFNSGDNTSLMFQLVGSGIGTPDEVWFDNITIEKLGGEEPVLNNVISGGQTSIRDTDDGEAALAFRFQVATAGTQQDAQNKHVAGSGTVVPYDDGVAYPLVRMGAVVTNSAAVGKNNEAMTLDGVDGKRVIHIPATYLSEVEEDSVDFAVRVINIPASGTGTDIYARPYYVYEDAEGNEITVYGETKSDNYNHVANPKAHIKILAIGNSFSVDAMRNHLYPILEDAGYDEIVLGNLYIGGCSLDTHWTNINNDSAAYEYYKTTDGTWKTTYSKKVSAALVEEDWDIITVQQASPSSGQPGTYGNLQKIVQYVDDHKTNPNAKIYWHMTWAYHTTNSNSGYNNYGKDQITMYKSITEAVKSKVLTNPLIDGVIPAGTAIQNMRTSTIDPALLTGSDGYHLHDTYGDYIAALTWYATISGEDVSGITYQPKNIAAYRDEVNEAVNNAVADPYRITRCSTYDNPKSIKVLSIGHSFSRDVMVTYLYDMLKEAGYEDITLGYLYYPGCSLSRHWEYISTNKNGHEQYGKNENGTWVTKSYPYAIDVLRDEDWDCVTLQASPDYVGGENKEYSYIPGIIDWIQENALLADVQIKWHMIWAYSTDCELWSYMYHDYDQLTMYENIIKATNQYIVPNKDISGIIPCGTSIQNGRTSFIGDNFNEPASSGDGYHLNTKYGDYTGSLTWACYFSGKDASIMSDYRPAGMTDEEFEAIAESVNNALADPYQITRCSTDDQPKSIKILSLGHSFSKDVMENYLYDMLKELGYEEIVLGYLHVPGASLSVHWDYISNHKNGYRHYGKTINGTWVNTNSPYAIDALLDEDWDYVTLQTSPDYVGGQNQEYSYIPAITDWIQQNATNPNVEIKWHMIWAFSEGCDLWSYAYHNYDQMTMYNNIVAVTKQHIVPNDTFTGIIPSCTAIQNARSSFIGDNFNEPDATQGGNDGYHLNTKYGDYTGSLTWACYFSGQDASIMEEYRPAGMTDAEFEAIAEAVNNALETPLAVTESTHK
ncbi:MAG: DUF4886 domain-containing protein [Clostridia bacterium]|nr:DUF4886 domain-containing protein [Clostridia bacterium]